MELRDKGRKTKCLTHTVEGTKKQFAKNDLRQEVIFFLLLKIQIMLLRTGIIFS